EFISQYHAHFHLQPVDLTPDWQVLLNNPALILLFADAEATADEIPTSLRPYLQAHQSTLLQAKTPHAWVAALSQDHFNEQLVTGDSATLSNKELDRLGISKRALIKANAAIGQKKTTLRFGWKYLPAATDSLHLVVFDRAEQRVTGLYRFRHGEISFPRNRLIKLSPQPD
ncbi:MAG TPA: hypothetical protein VFM46_13515, partial [Pseudomonadales bacterium]|nr:hypothetical protein [Pseudomonadales bacterium]